MVILLLLLLSGKKQEQLWGKIHALYHKHKETLSARKQNKVITIQYIIINTHTCENVKLDMIIVNFKYT